MNCEEKLITEGLIKKIKVEISFLQEEIKAVQGQVKIEKKYFPKWLLLILALGAFSSIFFYCCLTHTLGETVLNQKSNAIFFKLDLLFGLSQYLFGVVPIAFLVNAKDKKEYLKKVEKNEEMRSQIRGKEKQLEFLKRELSLQENYLKKLVTENQSEEIRNNENINSTKLGNEKEQLEYLKTQLAIYYEMGYYDKTEEESKTKSPQKVI